MGWLTIRLKDGVIDCKTKATIKKSERALMRCLTIKICRHVPENIEKNPPYYLKYHWHLDYQNNWWCDFKIEKPKLWQRIRGEKAKFIIQIVCRNYYDDKLAELRGWLQKLGTLENQTVSLIKY